MLELHPSTPSNPPLTNVKKKKNIFRRNGTFALFVRQNGIRQNGMTPRDSDNDVNLTRLSPPGVTVQAARLEHPPKVVYEPGPSVYSP